MAYDCALEAESASPLLSLIPELLCHLLSSYHLSAQDLVACSATSRFFRQSVETNVGSQQLSVPIVEFAARAACFNDSIFQILPPDVQQDVRRKCGGSWIQALHFLQCLQDGVNFSRGQVLASRDFSLVVSATGRLFSFGSGGDFCLGTGRTENVWSPLSPGGMLTACRVRQVAAGPRHVLVCCEEGDVFAFGVDQAGCLGTQNVGSSVPVPTRIPIPPPHARAHIVQVATGFDFSILLSADSEVFTLGSNSSGCLGLGTAGDELVPRVVEALNVSRLKCQVVRVAAGVSHSLAVTSRGDLFTWGAGSHGKLGHGTRDTERSPRLVKHLRTQGVHVVDAKGGGDITIALGAAGDVFTWGWGSSGRLGHGGYGDEMLPKRVLRLEGVRAVQVGASARRTFVVSDRGQVLTFGWSAKRALELASHKIAQISMGSGHTIALTTSGKILTYGNGERGQLGFAPDREDMRAVVPTEVTLVAADANSRTGPPARLA